MKHEHTMIADPYLESKLLGDQAAALEFVKEFIKSDERVAVLRGFPGTGKTHMINCIATEYTGKMQLLAPTHKAKIVVEKATGLRAETVHKANGLKPQMSLAEFSVNNLLLGVSGAVSLIENDLIVNDEASMSNQAYMDLNAAHMNPNAKILYLGDFYQLPPVSKAEGVYGTELSPVFNIPYCFDMRNVVRQKDGNTIKEFGTAIRYDIDNMATTASEMIARRPNGLSASGEGYRMENVRDTLRRSIDLIIKYRAKSEFQSYRIFAYTRDAVSAINNTVRNSVMKTKYLIDEGEFITSQITIYDDHMNPSIINSIDYVVINCRSIYDNAGMKCFVTTLLNVDDGKEEQDAVFVDQDDPQTMQVFVRVYNELKLAAERSGAGMAKKQKWEMFYNFIHTHLTILPVEAIYKHQPSFTYGYACTTHKAQGTTCKEACIMLQDLTSPRDKALSNRLLHVAATRPIHRLDIAY